MCVHGSQAVYCTTELCLSVDKLKEEKKKGRNDVSVQRSMSILRILAECARILQRGCHKSCAKRSTLVTTCDLAVGDFAIECFGVHATENLDDLVATFFVRIMMKGRRLRPVDFPILNYPLQFCSQCFIEWSLPYSLVLRNTRILSWTRTHNCASQQ